MDALLQLLATLAAAGLLTDEQATDLTTRLEAVEPIPADQIEGVATSADADRTAAENAGMAALGNADPDLLADVRTALVAAAQNDDASTPQVIEIANHVEGIQYVEAVGSEIAVFEQEQRDAAIARITPAAEADPVVDPDPGDGGELVVDADPVVDPDADPVLEPVLAAGIPAAPRRPRAGDIGRANRANANRTPVTDAQEGPTERQYSLLTDMNGVGRMQDTVPESEFIAGLTDRMNTLSRADSGSGIAPQTVASVVTEYPEDRILGPDVSANGVTVRDRVAAFREELASQTNFADAIARVVTAAGGICAPVEPHYDYPMIGDDGRPVLDFLPSWNASRGGVSSRIPATLASIGAVNTTGSGVSYWTAANDLSPSEPATKVVLTATCPSLTTTQIAAVVTRLKHGNFMGLYDPETVEMWVHLQRVAAAGIAESKMLTTINANSIQVLENSPSASTAGFARSFLNNIDRLVTAERYRQRIGENDVVDMLAPSWTRAALRDDRVLEIPGSANDPFRMTDAEIDRWFTDRGIRTGWFRDTQAFAAQGGSTSIQGQLAQFPARVKAFLFEPGHFIALDGGRLDLGVERSPTLNDTNDTQTFSEKMENVHPRGIFAYALETIVCVSGATAGTVTPVCTS